MLASQIRTVAFMLRRDPQLTPDLISTAAARLDELAQCVQAVENSAIPSHILAAAGVTPLPDNVVRFPVREVRQ